jgi:hypothetical protein
LTGQFTDTCIMFSFDTWQDSWAGFTITSDWYCVNSPAQCYNEMKLPTTTLFDSNLF